jgi:RNA polymerase sigma factor (sigma-70 family)
VALLDESPHRTPARRRRWSTTSDAGLVRGATAGHDGAFEEIFARYHAPLVRYCRGILLDDDLAQDAAQNALTNALRALGAGSSHPQALGPWLYRIAQREAADLARRRRREAARQAQDADGADLLANVPAPADERVRDRLRELLGDLSRLPLRQRSALLLRELSGLGYGDIAVALDTTPAAARQSVLEARQALAQAGSGRQDSCAAVRELVDGGDRRRLRARRVRAHLDDCLPCHAFAATITDRRRDLALLFPLGPAAIASSSGAFAVLTGGGAAAGGGAVAASGWSLGLGGLGASGAAKCAVVCATAAIVGVGSLAEKAVHPSHPASPVTVVAQAPQPGDATTPAVPAPASASGAKPAVKPARRTAVVRASTVRHEAAVGVRASTTSELTPPAKPATTPEGEPAAPQGAAAPAPPATTPAATTPAPTTAPAPSPTPAATPSPSASASAGTSRQQLALELQRRTQQAVEQATAQVTTATAPAVRQPGALVQQVLTAGGQAVQQVTTTALTGVQAQVELLRRLMRPQR